MRYEVQKLASNGNDTNLGILSGEDVKKLLKGYTYDEEMELWFSAKANVGYWAREA